MRRELNNPLKKRISKKTVSFEEFLTQSLYRFSKKNEYEIHLLEELLESSKETNKLLRKFTGEKLINKDESIFKKAKDVAGDLFDDGKLNKSNQRYVPKDKKNK